MMRTLGKGAESEVEIEGRSARYPGPGMKGAISDGCLRVFGLRLVSGRDFTAVESTGEAPLVLINEPMARSLWPSSSAIGQRLRLWSKGKPAPWNEIIGVVAERTAVREGAESHSILSPIGPAGAAWLQVRTRGDRGLAMRSLSSLIRELDPRISSNVSSLETVVDLNRMGPRLVAAASLLVVASSLLMAAIGLYGVTAYIASRRTKEIGIRMALGAQSTDVLRLMVRQGVILVGAGLVAGSLLAMGAERILAASLQLLPARPAQTYLATAAFLAAVALTAMLVPSLRATRIDPLAALRHD